jgi:hypothetical protein
MLGKVVEIHHYETAGGWGWEERSNAGFWVVLSTPLTTY